jgi:hypothetical protein
VPRASVVNARRPGHRPGRSEAESIDDAEHGASIIGAMVCSSLEGPIVVLFFMRTALVREPIPAEHISTLLTSNVRAGGAVLLNELGSNTATRDRTNDGVNDSVRAPWGQVQGTTAGSFTPSLVQ